MSMDEKQWLVSRLDTTHKTLFDEFQLSKEDFIRIREDLTSSIKDKRNEILSGVIFVLTLLIGLYETKWINSNLFLCVLVPDLIIGLGTFLILNKCIKSTSIAFVRVENSIIEVQQSLNHNFGYLIKGTLYLTNVQMSTLKEYEEFMRALAGIVYIPFGNALKESSKSKELDLYYKQFFATNARTFEKVIDPSIFMFNQMNKQNLPAESLQYVNDTILKYVKGVEISSS